MLPDDQGDLHIPHYVNLFGGTVFLEPLGRFEKRLRKAFASTAADMMTSDPDAIGPDTTVRDAARLIHDSGHNRLPVVDCRRAPRGRDHARGPAGRPRPVSRAERALARIDPGAMERNARRLRPGGEPRPCAPSSRPTATGTAPRRRPRPRSAAAPRWLAVATAAEAAGCATRDEAAAARHGRPHRGRASRRRGQRRRRGGMDPRTGRRRPGRSEGHGSTSSSTPAWEGSAPRTWSSRARSSATARRAHDPFRDRGRAR